MRLSGLWRATAFLSFKPNLARSGRNLRFCLNTPTIAAYPRISGSVGGNRERRKAPCHAGCKRTASNKRRRSHPGGRWFEFVPRTLEVPLNRYLPRLRPGFFLTHFPL